MVTAPLTPREEYEPRQFQLKLYVAGGKPESELAISRIRQILLENKLESPVEIVDIQKEPGLAKEAQIICTPILVREYPLPRRAVVGDLANADVVLRILGLSPANQATASAPHTSAARSSRPASKPSATAAARHNAPDSSARGMVEGAHLTPREMDVLMLMGKGNSNTEISNALGIATDTSKKHTKKIIEKLAARNRTHAAIIGAQARLRSPAFA